mmetsp:Transcript_55778/g.104860  ORF Transcript_55778/g.104860 Transcript_55778/m.104860 type:complete len:470 (-) Transcript_55778:192-1601(-)
MMVLVFTVSILLAIQVGDAQAARCPPSGCPADATDDIELIQKHVKVDAPVEIVSRVEVEQDLRGLSLSLSSSSSHGAWWGAPMRSSESLLQVPAALQKSAVAKLLHAAVREQVGVHSGSFTSYTLCYLGSLGLCSSAIAFIYWPHGLAVILKILAFLLLGSTVTISVKLVYEDEFRFNFPKLLTTFHLIVSSIVGFLILFYRKYEQSKAIEIPTVSEFVWKLLPLCLGFTYSLGCGNMALLYCSVGFAAILGASTPFFSIALMTILGMPFNWLLLFPVSGIVFGCMATVMGTVECSMYGLVLVLLSNAGRAVKAVVQQQLMTGEVQEKYDPVTLLAWQSLICTPLMLIWTVWSEGTPAFTALMEQTRPGAFITVVALSCANGAALNALHIFVIKDLGAVGIQASSQLKQGLITLGGVLLLGETFTFISVIGGSVVLISAFWYTRMETMSKTEECSKQHGHSKAERKAFA